MIDLQATPIVVWDIIDWPAPELRFWEVHEGKQIGPTLTKDGLEAHRLVRARDGRAILVAFRSSVAEFWDLRGNRRLTALPELSVADLTLQPDPRTLVSVARDGTVRWWDPATGQPRGESWRSPRCLQGGHITPDGRSLVVGCGDGRVRLFDLASRQPYPTSIPVDFGYNTSLALSPEGAAVLVMYGDGAGSGSVQLWQLGNLRSPAVPDKRMTAAGAPRLQFTVSSFAPDRQTAFVGGAGPNRDDYGRLVELTNGQLKGRPLGPGAGVPWRRTSVPVQPLIVDGPTFSPDGRVLATCTFCEDGREQYARVWDAASGQARTPPLRFPQFIHALAFSPDSKTLALGYGVGVGLWELDTARLKALLIQPGPVARLAFSPDGRWLAGAIRTGWGNQPGFQLWDLTRGERVGDLTPMDEAPLLRFTADSRALETFELPVGRLRRWDPENAKPLDKEITLERWQPPHHWCFQDDWRRLLTGSSHGMAQQWDVASGRPIGPPMTHAFPVVGLEYAPDGQTLAVGCDDGSVRLWDSATCQPLGPPRKTRAGLVGLAFSRDGRTLLTIDRDGATRGWPVPVPTNVNLDRLTLWLTATTGRTADGDDLARKAPASWEERRRLFRERGPEAEVASPGADRPVDWHETRAREAEEAGDIWAARWHLDRLLKLAPDRPEFHYRRARTYSADKDYARADADYARAAKLADAQTMTNWQRHRAQTCRLVGQHETAVWYLDRLLAGSAKEWQLYADRAAVHGLLGKEKEQEGDEAAAIAHGADREFLLGLADARAKAGRWADAAELCGRANGDGRLDVAVSYRQGLALLHIGDRDAHRKLCAQALTAAKATRTGLPAEAANTIAMLCALGPDTVQDWSAPLALVRQALATLERGGLPAEELQRRRHAWLNTEGALLYRAGKYPDAIARLTEAVAGHGDNGTTEDWIFLAMAHHRLRDTDKAQTWWMKVTNAKSLDHETSPWVQVELQLLRREAQTFLEPNRKEP